MKARYEIRCEVELPVEVTATEQEIEDWAAFFLNATGSLLGSNPLASVEFEALPFSVRARGLR